MYSSCGVIEGIAGLSVTLIRIAGGKSMVDGSLTVISTEIYLKIANFLRFFFHFIGWFRQGDL